MNSRERFMAVMDFDTSVKPPLWEWGYWEATLDNWQQEITLPADYVNQVAGVNETGKIFFGDVVKDFVPMDTPPCYFPEINTGMLPEYEKKVLAEDEKTVTMQNEQGQIMRISRAGDCVPSFIDWPVRDRESFEDLKARLQVRLEKRYPANWPEIVAQYNERDCPLFIAGYPYGFFASLREWMGFERCMFFLCEEPDLIKSMLDLVYDFLVGVWTKAAEDLQPEAFIIWEDMAYKNGPLISPQMFQELMIPYYKKLTRHFRDLGVKHFVVDTDGDFEALIPAFLDGGVTGIYPCEVAAGMDVTAIRKAYPSLQLMGGMNKIDIARGPVFIDQEIESKVPFMCKRGGYIPHVDHFVSSDISWQNFKYYREKLMRQVDRCFE